ncbi:hypothetical protein [Longimicrobium sp.]|jgi:hypothetical protein|uniref:hypothetical protein n=1 Tax=Longimicrobium sp. TaxID=2029185 RepID=UPI002F937DEC
MRISLMPLPVALALLAAAPPSAAAQAVPDSLFRLLDYEVRESGPLRFAGRELATVRLRDHGATADGGAVLELFPEWHPPTEPMEAQAGAWIAEMKGVRDVAHRSGTGLVLDDLPAYEIVADARNAAGTPLVLYQVTIADMGRVVVLQGRMAAEAEGRLLPHFREVARSFRRTAVLRQRLGSVAYEVTGGYQPVPALSDARMAVYHDPRTHSSLFAALLDSDAERDSVAGEAARRLFDADRPGDPQPASWQRLKAQRLSPAEVYQERRLGRSGPGIIVLIRHLRKDGQNWLTGYAFVSSVPHSDSYPASDASAWLIRSAGYEVPDEAFAPLTFGALLPPEDSPRARADFREQGH